MVGVTLSDGFLVAKLSSMKVHLPAVTWFVCFCQY